MTYRETLSEAHKELKKAYKAIRLADNLMLEADEKHHDDDAYSDIRGAIFDAEDATKIARKRTFDAWGKELGV